MAAAAPKEHLRNEPAPEEAKGLDLRDRGIMRVRDASVLARESGPPLDPHEGGRSALARLGPARFDGCMKASYVMSAPAIVVFPDMTVKEAGSILAGHRISGAPVVDRTTRRLVGMLSEGDLLGADRAGSGRAALVAEVMSPEVVSVDDTTDVKAIAARLLEADVHRAPVMHGEEVVGVVSRHDLLKQMCRSDATITVEVANLLKAEGTALAHLEVEVKDGIAFVHGEASTQTRALALELAKGVPGVLGAQLQEPVAPARGWVQVSG